MRKTVLVLAGCGATLAATAHEFWLQPPRFFIAAGTVANLRVLVGEKFEGHRWPGKSNRITSLVHYAPNDTLDLTALATQDDSLRTNVEFVQPGVHMVALATNNASITMSATEFNTYLKEDGFDNVLAIRQKQKSLDKPGREIYRRCSKTLLQVGPSSLDTVGTFAWRAGLPLELVPEQNPYALKPGAALTVLLLANGQPLPNTLVQVWQRSPDKPTQIFRLHSNQKGRVLFRLQMPGNYMVSAVQMVPATDQKAADWQSTWSTLTFGFSGHPAN
ncbi:DUF4198 domain-containing protein [Hymenobacter jejuensis]|uniref:DUF4198 domain-containing protein n=1 Tax=Hymenobacter jejuensis TaxID=2502781 RepID=UPI0013FCFFEE|nr:DUF4198 domain-containing protein [Hymenobacter jejuensis]